MPTIILDTLTCIRDGDLWGRAEPYMWNFFFGLDSPPIQDPSPGPNDALRVGSMDPLLFAPATGHHGNLGVSKVGRGQTIPIPPPVGTKVIPMTNNTIMTVGGGPPTTNWASIGVVSMLLEQDMYMDAGVQSGYIAMRMLIESQLKSMINNKMDAPSNRPAFQPIDIQTALAPLLQAGLPGQVKAAIMGSQDPLRNLACMLRPDDLIGVEVFMWDMRQLLPGPSVIPFYGSYDRRGLWEVRGRVTNP